MSSVGSFFSYVNDARSHEPESMMCLAETVLLLQILYFTRGGTRGRDYLQYSDVKVSSTHEMTRFNNS